MKINLCILLNSSFVTKTTLDELFHWFHVQTGISRYKVTSAGKNNEHHFSRKNNRYKRATSQQKS